MIYTHTTDTWVPKAHLIPWVPDGPLPAFVMPHGLGKSASCSIDSALRARIGIRQLGMTLSIKDLLVLAGGALGYKVVSATSLCGHAVDDIRHAIVGALQKLLRKAVNNIPGLDCETHSKVSFGNVAKSLARSIEVSGGNEGLSISLDWTGLILETLQYAICDALNSVIRFAARVAADVAGVTKKLLAACTACETSAKKPAKPKPPGRASAALTHSMLPPGASASSGGGSSYGGRTSYGSSDTNLVPILAIGSLTALGGFFIWRKRRRR